MPGDPARHEFSPDTALLPLGLAFVWRRLVQHRARLGRAKQFGAPTTRHRRSNPAAYRPLQRWGPTLLFTAAMLLAITEVPRPDPPIFVVPDRSYLLAAQKLASEKPSRFKRDDLPRPTLSAHSATLTELRGVPGQPVRLAAAWFGGSREGARDVGIYFSEWTTDSAGKGIWSEPQAIMTRSLAERQLGRNIRTLGNPLLMTEPEGALRLVFVSVSYGGWSGSSINLIRSTDGGRNWTNTRRLVTTPFFNLSTLVRNPGSWLTDGSLGLPVYQEFMTQYSEWLRLSFEGRILDKDRMTISRPTLQPAVVTLGATDAVVALRDAGPGVKHIQWATSTTVGNSWVDQSPRHIPNPNSAIAMIRLRDDSLLMAANPLNNNRNRLALLRSYDIGNTWVLARIIEDSPNDRDEFSYPALLQDQTGTIHLVYTWLRRGIRHVQFTQAWLNQEGNAAASAAPQ